MLPPGRFSLLNNSNTASTISNISNASQVIEDQVAMEAKPIAGRRSSGHYALFPLDSEDEGDPKKEDVDSKEWFPNKKWIQQDDNK